MKILQINKFLYPKGGADVHFLGLIDLLKKHGHDLIVFSQKNEKNIATGAKEYLISNIDLDKFYFKNIFKIFRIFWSLEARKKMRELIAKEKPEIAHIHNIYHQISPSILPVLKKAGIPIVMTVHDFKLIKPDYTLWIDEKNKTPKSPLAKLLLVLEFYFHQLLKTYEKNIDLLIAPSEFVKNRLVENGWPAEKIVVLPHFVEAGDNQPIASDEKYILSFGRLDESKGVDVLIRAFAPIQTNGVKLKIAGSGSQKNQLQQLVKKMNAEKQIEFLGQKNKTELTEIIKKSLFTVFPSRVQETFGLGILESFANYKPAIAVNTGAFTELIKHNYNGLLFPTNNEVELSRAMAYLINNPSARKTLGQNGRETIENKKFNPLVHYPLLMNFYNQLIFDSKKYKINKQYQLEKLLTQKILTSPKNSTDRKEIIKQANNTINTFTNKYIEGGIHGRSGSTLKMIKKITPAGAKVLDFGCGDGDLLLLLNQANYDAYGFEVSETGLINTEKKLEQIGQSKKILFDNLENTPDGFDLIVMDNVIEHIAPDEMNETVAKCYDQLKPGGQLLIITPHRFAGPHDVSQHFLPLGAKAEGLHLKEFSVAELANLLKKNRFVFLNSYIINPRLTEKFNMALTPRKIWLNKAIILEQIFSLKPLNLMLKIKKNITRAMAAILFPAIIIAKK